MHLRVITGEQPDADRAGRVPDGRLSFTPSSASVGSRRLTGFGLFEGVELGPDAVGVVGALLCLVQLQRFPPRGAGRIMLAEGGVRVAQPVESVGDFVEVAEVATQGKGLLVVVDGLVVTAGVVVDVAQAVQVSASPSESWWRRCRVSAAWQCSRARSWSPSRAAYQPTSLRTTSPSPPAAVSGKCSSGSGITNSAPPRSRSPRSSSAFTVAVLAHPLCTGQPRLLVAIAVIERITRRRRTRGTAVVGGTSAVPRTRRTGPSHRQECPRAAPPAEPGRRAGGPRVPPRRACGARPGRSACRRRCSGRRPGAAAVRAVGCGGATGRCAGRSGSRSAAGGRARASRSTASMR